MSNARNLAKLIVDANGDIGAASLDNVPPSNDASALTTGTLPVARIADGDITAAKLYTTAVTDKLGYTPMQRSDLPYPVRMTNGFLGGFDTGWAMAYATRTVVQSVTNGTAWGSRTTEEQNLLMAMGRSGVTYLHSSFNIVRLTWGTRDAGQYLLPYTHIPLYQDFKVTSAAFVKWESGSLPNSQWCTGLTKDGNWTWCKSEDSGAGSGYTYNHPYQDPTTNAGGSILVALPGVWIGRLHHQAAHNIGVFASVNGA